ncbi:hypothetical protein [Flavisolibacter nicotianae]|uniref:hypothetical protein n=1 Tax=Flavisolibacter nicotianae TaxID=2364882 RepID=UPI000EAEC244|nr:hypothetical protein [Flavisolibacter nicotianae]
MKQKLLLAAFLVIGIVVSSAAQTTAVKKQAKQKTAKQGQAKAVTGKTKYAANNSSTVVLRSVSENNAYAPATRPFTITDPTITTLNQQANGAAAGSSRIAGMPKGTYGFANGKLFLRPTTANSSGTVSGSGAVGTGTTIIGVGTSENSPGVNGKNPNAGTWLWGDRLATRPTTTKQH